jgi:uncharacterized membrane protein
MSDLIVAIFDGHYKAEEVRHDLQRMERQDFLDLEDAVTLVRDKEGEVKIHHMTHLTAEGAVSGGFLGTLFGVMLLNPVFAVFGLLAGTAIGALEGSSIHLGIDEKFMEDLSEHLKPGTSALCVQVKESAPDILIEELEKYDGKILQTSLSEEDEKKLREALGSPTIDTGS